jgi:hypothetical protein
VNCPRRSNHNLQWIEHGHDKLILMFLLAMSVLPVSERNLQKTFFKLLDQYDGSTLESHPTLDQEIWFE